MNPDHRSRDLGEGSVLGPDRVDFCGKHNLSFPKNLKKVFFLLFFKRDGGAFGNFPGPLFFRREGGECFAGRESG